MHGRKQHRRPSSDRPDIMSRVGVQRRDEFDGGVAEKCAIFGKYMKMSIGECDHMMQEEPLPRRLRSIRSRCKMANGMKAALRDGVGSCCASIRSKMNIWIATCSFCYYLNCSTAVVKSL